MQFRDMTQADFAFAQVSRALSLVVSRIEKSPALPPASIGWQRLLNMTIDTAAPEQIRFEEAPQVALEDVAVLTPNTHAY